MSARSRLTHLRRTPPVVHTYGCQYLKCRDGERSTPSGGTSFLPRGQAGGRWSSGVAVESPRRHYPPLDEPAESLGEGGRRGAGVAGEWAVAVGGLMAGGPRRPAEVLERAPGRAGLLTARPVEERREELSWAGALLLSMAGLDRMWDRLSQRYGPRRLPKPCYLPSRSVCRSLRGRLHCTEPPPLIVRSTVR